MTLPVTRAERVFNIVYVALVIATTPIAIEMQGSYAHATVRVRAWLASYCLAVDATHALLLLIGAWLVSGSRAACLLGAALGLAHAIAIGAWTDRPLATDGVEVRALTALALAPSLPRAVAWLLLAARPGPRRLLRLLATGGDLLLVLVAMATISKGIVPVLHPMQTHPLGLIPFVLAGLLGGAKKIRRAPPLDQAERGGG